LSGLAPLPGLTEDYTNYHPQAGPYEIANIPYGYTAESGVGITQEMIYQVPQKEENLEEGGGGVRYPLTWFIQQQTAFPTRPGHQEVEQLGRPQQFMVKQTSLHPLSSILCQAQSPSWAAPPINIVTTPVRPSIPQYDGKGDELGHVR